MKNTISEWESLSSFLEAKLVYDMGAEKIEIDSSVLSTLIVRNSDGSFDKNSDGSYYIDKNKTDEFIDCLCDKYYTYKQPRKYVTYKGEEKNINLSVYGTELNRKAEKQYFYDAVCKGINEYHYPEYLHEGFTRGLDDIGNTFVEVDLTNQKLYYVVSGELKMECDIVSGKPSGGNETPEVVACIIRKSKNTYLRGADYVSFVKYWMPFYSGDGFHDANWQKAFGGDRYIKYGSHGCINMRTEEAEELYSAIEVGTPVIIYK